MTSNMSVLREVAHVSSTRILMLQASKEDARGKKLASVKPLTKIIFLMETVLMTFLQRTN